MKIELVREFNIKFEPDKHPNGHVNDLSFYLIGQCSVPQIPPVGTCIISPFIGEEDDFRHEYNTGPKVKQVQFIWLKKGVLFPSVVLENCEPGDFSDLEPAAESFFNACIEGTVKWMFDCNFKNLIGFGKIYHLHEFEIDGAFYQGLLSMMERWYNDSK